MAGPEDENGFFMNWTGTQAGEGFEYHVLAMGLALVVCMKGSGALSIDGTLTRRDVKPSPYEVRPPLAHVGASTPDAQ